MSKKKKNKQANDVVKALRRAERELQLERNGYDHPWIVMTIIHKNKKAYDRKRDRKNFNYNSDGLSFFSLTLNIQFFKNITHSSNKVKHIIFIFQNRVAL